MIQKVSPSVSETSTVAVPRKLFHSSMNHFLISVHQDSEVISSYTVDCPPFVNCVWSEVLILCKHCAVGVDKNWNFKTENFHFYDCQDEKQRSAGLLNTIK
jgi:hypothetical protein